MYRQVILAGLSLIPGLCYAGSTIYQYTDADGNLVISNNPENHSNKHSGRREILQEELAKEQQLLKDSNNLLVQNAKLKSSDIKEYQKRNDILKDAVNEHQKNIQILNKQLGYSPK